MVSLFVHFGVQFFVRCEICVKNAHSFGAALVDVCVSASYRCEIRWAEFRRFSLQFSILIFGQFCFFSSTPKSSATFVSLFAVAVLWRFARIARARVPSIFAAFRLLSLLNHIDTVTALFLFVIRHSAILMVQKKEASEERKTHRRTYQLFFFYFKFYSQIVFALCASLAIGSL